MFILNRRLLITAGRELLVSKLENSEEENSWSV